MSGRPLQAGRVENIHHKTDNNEIMQQIHVRVKLLRQTLKQGRV